MTFNSSTRGLTRSLAALTASAGSVLLLRPGRLARWSSGSGLRPDVRIIRVLGGRQLAQGTAQIIRPSEVLVAGGMVVDTLHLLSMLGVAVIWPAYRRPALISAAEAGFFGLAGAAILTVARRPPSGPAALPRHRAGL